MSASATCNACSFFQVYRDQNCDKHVIHEHYAVIYQLPIFFVGFRVGVWRYKAIEMSITIEIILDFIVAT